MQFQKPPLDSLLNESDVEQKFLFPLLVSDEPGGLGHDPIGIQTKASIRRFTIGKGSDKKSYFPDYIVTRNGVPLIVLEGKTPGSNLEEAFREARLYAAELNAIYTSGINPLGLVIASDGKRLVAGPADQAEPEHDLSFDDVDPYNERFSAFQQSFGMRGIGKRYDLLQPKIRPKRYWMPRRLVGGTALQKEEIPLNTFGATISADFGPIFKPANREDRARIAKEAYIPSRRRERYIEPIDRIIRASTPASESGSRTIEDTSAPSEIIKTFRDGRPLEHQVMLIVGSAGAGKTTFVDYLQEVAIPRDVRARTIWLRVDMNPAPISRTEIYDWLRGQIVQGLRDAHPEVDCDSLQTLKSIHGPEVTKFRKGVGRLYEGDKATYNLKLAEQLEKAMSDRHQNAVDHARHFSTERGKLLVIVLDNSDKRLRDEQLLMFEAAQWLQKEFRALVILPLREETYDNHRNEPPLDTVLKDLVFRIEPPLFQNILFSRIKLVLKSIASSNTRMLTFTLPNGFKVEYPAEDQAFYLSSIMRSLFEHDLHVRRLIVGLAGRNMRRALEIFLEFCTSGHIDATHILKIRQSQGTYVLPLGLVTTVLLRQSQRFYDSERAYLKNVYGSNEKDQRPHYFARLLILRWLHERQDVMGAKRLRGFCAVRDLRADLSNYGVDVGIFWRELEYLTQAFCILSEDFRTVGLTDEDLVRLSPAGLVHLKVCDGPYYLAAVAEDSWFSDEKVAERIAERIKQPDIHFQPRTALYNALDILSELEAIRDRELVAYKAVFADDAYDRLIDLSSARRAVERFQRELSPGAWARLHQTYPVGSTHTGVVTGRKRFGVFIELEQGVTGLIHSSRLPYGFYQNPALSIGSQLTVEVMKIDQVRERIDLALR